MSKIQLPIEALAILQLCAPSEPITDSAPRYLLLEAEGGTVRLSITNGIAAARITVQQPESVQGRMVLVLPLGFCLGVYSHALTHGAELLVVTERAIVVEPCEFVFEQSHHPNPGWWLKVFDPQAALGSGNEFSALAIAQLAERAALFSDFAHCAVTFGADGNPMVFRSANAGIEFEGVVWPGCDFDPLTEIPQSATRSLYLHDPGLN